MYELPMELVINVIDMLQPLDIVHLDTATVCHQSRITITDTCAPNDGCNNTRG